jgi:G3E family GTPase
VPGAELPGLEARLRVAGMRGRLLPAEWGRFPMALLFASGLHAAGGSGRRAGPAAERFQTLGWTADRAVNLEAFQALMQRLAPALVRAKGLLEIAGRPVLFQMAGRRATLAAGPEPALGEKKVRLVLIHEIGALDEAAVRRELNACLTEN